MFTLVSLSQCNSSFFDNIFTSFFFVVDVIVNSCYVYIVNIFIKLIKLVKIWSRADFKLEGNLGLIGPAVTGILHCNVINHAIISCNKRHYSREKDSSTYTYILFLLHLLVCVVINNNFLSCNFLSGFMFMFLYIYSTNFSKMFEIRQHMGTRVDL